MKRSHVQLIILTLVAATTVLLFLARTKPHIPEEQLEADAINRSIDSAIAQVNGPNPMQGILALRSIAESNPDNVRAQLNLGIFSLQTGQYDKAEARFQQVLALDPEFDQGHFFMGRLAWAQGNEKAALTSFQKALELTEDEALQEEIEKLINELNN